MDSPNNQVVSRNSVPRDVRRRYLLVCEGAKTEPNYFKCIKEHCGDFRISNLIGLEVADKNGIDYNQSDIEKLIAIAKSDLLFLKEGKHTARHYVVAILDGIYDSVLSNHHLSDKEKDDNKNKLGNLFKSLQDELSKAHLLDARSVVIDEKRARELCKSMIEKDLGFKVDQYINVKVWSRGSYYDEDIVCIVHDRDKSQKFTDDKYRKAMKKCEAEHFRPVISCPKFEFWLLLHLCNPKDLDRKQLMQPNNKAGDYVSDMLVKKAPDEKDISNDIFTKYYQKNTCLAIRNAKLFCQSENKMVSEPGTSMGRLMMEIINNCRNF